MKIIKVRHGFVSLIGILITLMILMILLSISLTMMSGTSKTGTVNEKAIMEKVDERLKGINQKQELRIKELEKEQ